MRVDETNRKRRKAPKTRTGCRPCKQAHVRCSEDRPECRRCLRLEKACQYATTSYMVSPEHHTPVPKTHIGLSRPSRSLLWQFLTDDDARALKHYISHTAPWIATHSPRTLRSIWQVTIPRCAASLPATRHALLAVALVDEPIPNATTNAVLARSRLILRHYNLAIHTLTRPGASPSPLDTTLTSILAWLLETLGFNSSLAKMHISAATSIAAQHLDPRLRALAAPSNASAYPSSSSSSSSDSSGNEAQQVWSLDIPALLSWATSYIAITPAAGQRQTPDELQAEVAANPVLEALLLRRGKCPITRAEEFRDAWVEYFTRLAPGLESMEDVWSGEGGERRMTVQEAQEFIAYWKIAVVRYRYVGEEPMCVILLGYTMSALARCLLPVDQEPRYPQWKTHRGSFDFILNRAEDMLGVEMRQEHKVLQEDLLCLLACTIMRFAKLEGQRERARAIWEACEKKTDWFALAEEGNSEGFSEMRSFGALTPDEDDLVTTPRDLVTQNKHPGTRLLLGGWPTG